MAKILVVEDDESMNSILVRTLMDLEHEVESAFNTKSAVELSMSKNFDLVVTDVRLPGKDGVEGLANIKRYQANIKCIVITGYASAETPARAIKLRVADYLLKPFSLKSFQTSVCRVLDVDGQKAARRELLSKLLPLPSRRSPEIERLIDEREQTLRGLYVGIRAGFLSHHAAREIYIKIEMLEEQFRRLLKNSSPERGKLTKVKVQYAAISDRIASFHIGNADEAPEDAIVLPAGQFSALFDAVKQSVVGLNDLDYAPLLRRVSDSRLEKHAELLELKKLLWPSVS